MNRTCKWRKLDGIDVGEHVMAVGDIHGRLDLLDALLQIDVLSDYRVPRLVFLGDVLDRGPCGLAALARVRDRVERHQDVLLLGNHEIMVLRALDHGGDALRLWLRNGGDAVLAEAGMVFRRGMDLHALHQEVRQLVSADIAGFLRTLPSHRWSPGAGCLFVHAGIAPGESVDDFLARPWDRAVGSAEEAEAHWAWIRETFLAYDWSEAPFLIVHGHTPRAPDAVVAELGGRRIGLDTAAVSTGVLTALELDGDRARLHFITAS